MVLPLLLMLLFLVIDGGRYLWTINRAEKATQMGARMAVVTDPVASGLVTENYLGVGGLTQGDVIPVSALGTIDCVSTGANCSCTGACPASLTRDSAAFNRILARVQALYPEVTAANLHVKYSGSGLGYAGDPYGMQVSPLVTVELTSMNFHPLALMPFGRMSIALPNFRTTLTAEDVSGTSSN